MAMIDQHLDTVRRTLYIGPRSGKAVVMRCSSWNLGDYENTYKSVLRLMVEEARMWCEKEAPGVRWIEHYPAKMEYENGVTSYIWGEGTGAAKPHNKYVMISFVDVEA